MIKPSRLGTLIGCISNCDGVGAPVRFRIAAVDPTATSHNAVIARIDSGLSPPTHCGVAVSTDRIDRWSLGETQSACRAASLTRAGDGDAIPWRFRKRARRGTV